MKKFHSKAISFSLFFFSFAVATIVLPLTGTTNSCTFSTSSIGTINFLCPQPLSSGSLTLTLMMNSFPSSINIQLFNELSLNSLQYTVQLSNSADTFTFTLTQIDLINFTLSNISTSLTSGGTIKIVFTDAYNCSQSTQVSGQFLISAVDSNGIVTSTCSIQDTDYQQSPPQCIYSQFTMSSQFGAHQKGEVNLLYDFQRGFFEVGDNIYLQFFKESEQNPLLDYSSLTPSKREDGAYPFDQLQSVLIDYSSPFSTNSVSLTTFSPSMIIVSNISTGFDLQGGYELTNQLQFTISEIYLPPSIGSTLKLYSQILTSNGYTRCTLSSTLTISSLSPFKNLTITPNSTICQAPIKLQISLSPQRYILKTNSTLEIQFSGNFPSFNLADIKFSNDFNLNTATMKVSYDSTAKVISIFNFLNDTLISSEILSFSITGLSNPVWNAQNAVITVQNKDSLGRYQHSSTLQYSLLTQIFNLSVQLSDKRIVAISNYSFSIKLSSSSSSLNENSMMSFYFPVESFINIADNSTPTSFAILINSTSIPATYTISGNTFTVSYISQSSLTSGSVITVTLPNITNGWQFQQIQMIGFKIGDSHGYIYSSELISLPTLLPTAPTITSWMILDSNFTLDSSRYLISFKIQSNLNDYGETLANKVIVCLSNIINIKNGLLVQFSDSFGSSLNYSITSQCVSIQNVALDSSNQYTLTFSNTFNPRSVSQIPSPSISVFKDQTQLENIQGGGSSLIVQIAQIYSSVTLLSQFSDNCVNAKQTILSITVGLGNAILQPNDLLTFSLDQSISISNLESLKIISGSFSQTLSFSLNQFTIVSSPSAQQSHQISFGLPSGYVQNLSSLIVTLYPVNNPADKNPVTFNLQVLDSLNKSVLKLPAATSLDILSQIQLSSVTLSNKSPIQLGNHFQFYLSFTTNALLSSSGTATIFGFSSEIQIDESQIILIKGDQGIQVSSPSLSSDKTTLTFSYTNLNSVNVQIIISNVIVRVQSPSQTTNWLLSISTLESPIVVSINNISCPQTNCDICVGSPAICNKCLNNYQLSGNSCLNSSSSSSDTNCLVYDQVNPQNCKTCSDGYVIDESTLKCQAQQINDPNSTEQSNTQQSSTLQSSTQQSSKTNNQKFSISPTFISPFFLGGLVVCLTISLFQRRVSCTHICLQMVVGVELAGVILYILRDKTSMKDQFLQFQSGKEMESIVFYLAIGFTFVSQLIFQPLSYLAVKEMNTEDKEIYCTSKIRKLANVFSLIDLRFFYLQRLLKRKFDMNIQQRVKIFDDIYSTKPSSIQKYKPQKIAVVSKQNLDEATPTKQESTMISTSQVSSSRGLSSSTIKNDNPDFFDSENPSSHIKLQLVSFVLSSLCEASKISYLVLTSGIEGYNLKTELIFISGTSLLLHLSTLFIKSSKPSQIYPTCYPPLALPNMATDVSQRIPIQQLSKIIDIEEQNNGTKSNMKLSLPPEIPIREGRRRRTKFSSIISYPSQQKQAMLKQK